MRMGCHIFKIFKSNGLGNYFFKPDPSRAKAANVVLDVHKMPLIAYHPTIPSFTYLCVWMPGSLL